MIKNLADYFMPGQKYYLDEIAYKRIEKSSGINEYTLCCKDDIKVDSCEENIKLTVTRSLRFDPEEVFELSISFGAILEYNKDKKTEMDWENINLADEFRENGQFVLNNLMSRIALLVANITSTGGQLPIIVPTNIVS